MATTERLVVVTWNDAEDQREAGWIGEDTLEKFEKDDCIVRSIGFVKSQTERYITLYGDFSPDPNTYGRVTKIPTNMITKVEEIVVKEGA